MFEDLHNPHSIDAKTNCNDLYRISNMDFEEKRKLHVVVLGAGVIGTTAAVHMLEKSPEILDVTLMAEQFSPNILSDKSGMIFFPDPRASPDDGHSPACHYQESEEHFKRWLRTSFEAFQSLLVSPDNAEIGISLLQGYALWNRSYPDPWWKDLVYGFRHVGLDSAEAKTFNVPPDCAEIWSYKTFTMNTTLFLQWLLKKAKKLGCKIVQRRVSDFSELASNYDVVVNATGLGSYKELARDPLLYPVKGQAVLVSAPWIKNWLACYAPDGVHTVIIPRGSEIFLGGTGESGNWNEEEEDEVAGSILKRCRAMVPSLGGAKVVGGWAGLRPGRDRVRLEACKDPSGLPVIHCYGHRGKGVMLSWGCAADILDLVKRTDLVL